MGQLQDLAKTVLRHLGDNSQEDLDNYKTNLDTNDFDDSRSLVDPFRKRDFSKCVNCEQAIIDCRKKHGRILGIESKFLRQKFGDQCFERALMRINQRKHRGRCDLKEQDENLEKTIQTFSQLFIKKDPFENESV